MIQYKYETHLHTSDVSMCASCPGIDWVDHYKSLGYAGIFVTNHFLNGGTTISNELPWSEQVDLFCKDYEAMVVKGKKVGLDVFFAWEYSYGWAHFLTYGLDKAWLLAHPDVVEWDIMTYFDCVHADGGFIVHAHPFREGIEHIDLFPNKIDAVEVLNSCRTVEANQHAADFAKSYNLPVTAGSDNHHLEHNHFTGVITSKKLTCVEDYIALIRLGDVELFDNYQQ